MVEPAAPPSRPAKAGRRLDPTPICRHGSRKHARRVRHLHHHLPGARSVHFPAPAQRARPAHRAASGRLTIPIRRASRCGRRRTMSSRCPTARRKPPPKPAEPAAPGRPSAGRALPRPGSPLAAGLDAIAGADDQISTPSISSTGARAAYEMIVKAFAEGDRRTLKNLLSREVYDGFESRHHRARETRRDGREPLRRRSTTPTSPPPNCAAAPRRSPCASSPSSSRSRATRTAT